MRAPLSTHVDLLTWVIAEPAHLDGRIQAEGEGAVTVPEWALSSVAGGDACRDGGCAALGGRRPWHATRADHARAEPRGCGEDAGGTGRCKVSRRLRKGPAQ